MSRLVLNRVIMHNFFSFSHAELDLRELGTTIVSGVNNRQTDNAKSNGSGKSSVFNAICYALTGETSQGLKTNIENVYGDPDDCWVELSLTHDADEFVIRRIRTPRTDLKIWLNGNDISGKGIRESTAVLNEYLPDLTPMFVGSVMILGQGMPYRFADQHPGGRKDQLERLTKSDFMVQSIREKLDLRQLELKAELRSVEDAKVATTTSIDIRSQQVKEIRCQLDAIDSYNSEYSLDERLVYLSAKIERNKRTLEELKQKRQISNKTYFETQSYLTSLVQSQYEARFAALKQFDDDLSALDSLCTEGKTKRSLMSVELAKLKSIKDVCPTCGQKLPDVHLVDTSKEEHELSVLNERLADLESQRADLLSKRHDLSRKIDEDNSLEVNQLKALALEASNDMKTLDSEIERLAAKLAEDSSEVAKVQVMKDSKTDLVNSLNSLVEQIEQLTTATKEANAKIIELSGRLDVIQKLITLTKKEFRGILLREVIRYLDLKAKQYSMKIFGTELLSVTLNDNAIDIMYDGKYYEALSGGEKQKVDIILQLALKSLLSSQLGIHISVLVLDEIMDNLDATGSQKVLELISSLDDIESIFIISHHVDELEISYDTEIVVTKGENGISTLSVR